MHTGCSRGTVLKARSFPASGRCPAPFTPAASSSNTPLPTVCLKSLPLSGGPAQQPPLSSDPSQEPCLLATGPCSLLTPTCGHLGPDDVPIPAWAEACGAPSCLPPTYYFLFLPALGGPPGSETFLCCCVPRVALGPVTEISSIEVSQQLCWVGLISCAFAVYRQELGDLGPGPLPSSLWHPGTETGTQ